MRLGEPTGSGWYVDSPDPSLPPRFEDSEPSPAWRRALEMTAKRRRN